MKHTAYKIYRTLVPIPAGFRVLRRDEIVEESDFRSDNHGNFSSVFECGKTVEELKAFIVIRPTKGTEVRSFDNVEHDQPASEAKSS